MKMADKFFECYPDGGFPHDMKATTWPDAIEEVRGIIQATGVPGAGLIGESYDNGFAGSLWVTENDLVIASAPDDED
ncbi:hypothetical protein CU048_12245 [Beijerinckiaceae bacterium]|nr:hypothetical protein CU048_12245 [Beijerinckiaceae bacterium]